MRKPVVLITGAGGEIGHGLIQELSSGGRASIVTVDLNALDSSLAPLVQREFTGSITDARLLDRILSEFERAYAHVDAELEVELDEDLEALGDRQLLKQVLVAVTSSGFMPIMLHACFQGRLVSDLPLT